MKVLADLSGAASVSALLFHLRGPLMTQDDWFFTRDNKAKYGPYSTSQMQQFASTGALLPTDMVCQHGTKWVLASTVTGFGGTPSVQPPPQQAFPAWLTDAKFWSGLGSVLLLLILLRAGCSLRKIGSDVTGKGFMPDGSATFNWTDASKLLDNTHTYKGKTLSIKINYDGGGFRRDDRLVSLVGTVFYRSGSFDISFEVPPGAPQPKVRPGDDLLVTFICKEGKLDVGNTVVKIERP